MKKALTILTSVVVPTVLLAPGAISAADAATSSTAHHRATQGHHKATGQYVPPPLTWGTCPTTRLKAAGAQCAMLTVPLDHARPKGPTIKIAVSRILHTNADYKGMIAVNPGGPGGSGLGLATLGRAVPNGVGAKFDWYGFDPRGVGRSEPALSCNPDYPGSGWNRPDYVPTNPADKAWWLRTAKQYTVDCAHSSAKKLLPYLRTEQVAADLDTLRVAVGQKKLNYYGFSYGTYLGQVYATNYPKHVGRMVWDGVVDAKRAFYQSNLDQDVWFDKNIDLYFNWLAAHNDAYGLGTDGKAIRAGYYQALARLKQNPTAGGKIGPDELADALQSAAYYVYDWDTIGHIYADFIKTGDGTGLLDLYSGPGDDNGFAIYAGVQCTDAPWPGWKKTERDSWRLHAQHPFLTWGNTWFNAPCLTWPAASGKAVKAHGTHGLGRILLISESSDAATPFSGALATRKAFKSSYLIEGVGGTTHAGSLSGVACTDDTVATYLDTGKLPARKAGNRADQKCDPVPPPTATVPTAAQQRSAVPQSTDPMPALARQTLEEAQLIGR
ncbi:alpha/beta fold hydrolase [Nocardioides sp.]|uniref:alpha/beta fold hydrolase n=1 Tax=Nocardioides sp. TaxID=35761 RepID=UPI00263537A9|nr:alpha/beta fold hydrolase [Nocardioides sp.]